MKQCTFKYGKTKRLIMLILVLIAGMGKSHAQSYYKVPKVNYRYSDMSLGTAKTLYIRSNLFSACPINTMPVYSQIKKANLNVAFNWNNDFNNSITNQYTLNYTITGYSTYSGTSGLVMTYSASVVINNNQPQAVVNIDFTGLYNTINRFVVTPVLTTTGINNTTMHGFVTSDVSYNEEFEYNVYSGTTGISSVIALNPIKITGDNLLTFSWQTLCDKNGVPPNYEFQLLRLYNSSNSTKTSESNITADIDWSKALSIETGNSKTELSLTIAEGIGYYAWRVRPIGNAYEGGIANDHNWGLWTNTGSYTQGSRTTITTGTSPYLFYFSYNAVDPYNPSTALITGISGPYPASTYSLANDGGRNWIFQRNFVEGDKVSAGQVTIGESVGYANKLQMASQQQSRIMSNAQKVISQSIYDYSGRGALNVLPTPVNKNTLSYEPGFVRNNANNPYSAYDFDYSNASGTGNYNNPSPMDSLPSAGGLTSPSMYYSSNNNNEDNVATAAGYPFSRAVFSKDGKNTVVESSMPGKEHRLNPTTGAVKHTTRQTEAAVADMELVRIFGDEAPSENSVYKTITVDPNNTSSVAYISKEGKTIATCLSSPGTGNLSPLASASSNSFTVSTNITTANSSVGEYAFHAFKTLTLTEQTNVSLVYSLTPNSYSDPSCISACSTCDYKITFQIIDNSGETAPIITSQVITPPGSGCVQTPVTNSSAITLQAGSYTIERIIEANTSPSGSSVTYLNSFIQAAQNTLSANLLTGIGTLVNDAGVPVPGAPSVVLQNVFTYIANTDLPGLYAYLGVVSGDTHKNVKIGCNVIRIPIWPCEVACDPNNLNFEAYFYNLYTPSGLSNQDKLDAMFGAGKYTVGNFDDVIRNMFTYGNYTCDSLWNCWKGTVAYFMALHNTTNNPQPPINLTIPGGGSYTPGSPDYLDHFLNCTRYKIAGIKTIAGSGVGPESSGGYKSHPYKWINYSNQCCGCEVAFVNTYATCGVTLPPSCPVTITGSGATCGTASGFITWFNSIDTALALPCISPITDNKISFYRCVLNNQNSGSVGSCNVQSSPNHMEAVVADDLLRECRNHCEGLYSEFITSEINLIHNGGTHIAGDPWELVAVPGGYEPGTNAHTPSAADVPLSKIYCNADAMMRFCKSQCLLTVQSPSGALGSASEIAAIQQLLTGTFVRSSAIPCGSGNTNASLVSDSVARTIVLMLNHGLSNKRRQVGPSGDWWHFNAFLNGINTSYATYFNNLSVFVHPDIPSYFKLTPGASTGNRISYYFNKNAGNNGTLSEKKIYSKDPVVSSVNFIYSSSGTSSVSAIVSDPGTDYIFSSAPSATFVPVSAAPIGTIMSVPNALADAQINISPVFSITPATTLTAYTNSIASQGYWVYNLCSSDITGSNAAYCDASACFTIVAAPTTAPPNTYVFDGTAPSCQAQTLADIATAVNSQLSSILSDYAVKLKGIYKTQCVQNLMDNYTASYPLKYHHYTLYYYDRAGNLVKTVPPAGVTTTSTDRMTHPTHAMITEYEYNSLSQLVRQKTPDGGETRFWYDVKGRLRFSQNAQQFNTNPYKFSYTKYDVLGRIIDVGESIDPAMTNNINVMNFPAASAGTDITRTFYSTPVPGIMYPGNKPQRFLQNRVSYSFTDRDGNTGTTNDQVATYYSYDPHGNVEWIVQDIPELGKNYIAYEYDLASGSVVKVRYNEHFNDRFFHRYTYDADKRIKTVETSTDNLTWEKDATYDYYLHGPLKRTLTGHDAIQGMDYAYTVNGWLKTLNGYSQAGDPGGDGSLVNNNMYVPRDAYAFVLGYHKNDYYCRNSLLNSGNATNNYTSTDLYNGNISSWQQFYDLKAMSAAMLSGFAYNDKLTAKTFLYDELNRLKEAKFLVQNASTRVWASMSDYQENFSYDANGNIMSLKRNGKAGSLQMDDLTYKYLDQSNAVYTVNPQAPAVASNITNKLGYVAEASGSYAGNYNDDIDGQTGINYTYDKIGNLTADPSEGITSIKWNVYGKIAEINKTVSGVTSKLTFLYDAAGNRVYKKSQNPASPVVSDRVTYYVKDATGNSMAVYERTNSGTASSYTATYALKEHPIYGSERLGTQNNGVVRTASFTSTSSPSPQGQPQPSHYGSSPYIMIPYGNITNTQVYTRDIYTVPGADIVLGTEEYVQTVSGSNTVEQQNSQALACDDQGNVILSAFTYKTYSGGSYTGDRTVLYTNDSYMVPGVFESLNNAAEAQAVFMKKPGSDDEYYYFTIGTDGKPYYHTIDLTSGEMLNINNLMDSNTSYGQTMALYEDRTGAGPSTLYLRRMDGGNSLLCPFTITESGISAQATMLIGEAVPTSSLCEMQISPSGSLIAIANNRNRTLSEIILYSLSSDHQTLSAIGTLSFTGVARSVEFSNNDVSVFYTHVSGFTTRLMRQPVSTFLTSTPTIMHTQMAASMTSSIRRGVNGNIYYMAASTSKPTDVTLHMFTSPDVSKTFVSNLLSGVIKGSLTIAPHKLLPYALMEAPVASNRVLDKKEYELKDHLGNVHATFKDYKVRYSTGSSDMVYEQRFDDNTTGVFTLAGGSPAGSSVSNTNQKMRILTGASTGAVARGNVPLSLAAPGHYMVSFDYSSSTNLNAHCSVTNASNGATVFHLTNQGRLEFVVHMPAGATTMNLEFTSTGAGSNLDYYIDNLLIKKLDEPNMVNVGTILNEHYNTPSNWIGTNTNVYYYSNQLYITSNFSGNPQFAKKTVNLTPNQLYRVSFSITSYDMSPTEIKLGFGNANYTEQEVRVPYIEAPINYTYYIIPSSGQTEISFGPSAATSVDYSILLDNLKIEQITGGLQPLYSAVLNNVVDYYAFGSNMPGRNFSSNSYRYGMNGQEKDDEIASGIYSALYWEYDSRLGRRWNIDPEPYPFMSDYSCFANNPILLTDPLGNRVKYGDDNSTRAERRRIKDQIKEERRNNSAFDTEFKAHKKDKDITYYYQDMRNNINVDGKLTSVTGATIHDRVIDDPSSKSDKTRIVAWNISLIKLPDNIPFVFGESRLMSDDEQRYTQNAADMNIDRTYSHRLKDDPIKSQVALWLSVDKSRSITIKIGQNDSYKFSGAFEDGVLSPSKLRKARESEIKAAFKSVPYINFRTQINIEKANNSNEETRIQRTQ